jgi:hypothetical protein
MGWNLFHMLTSTCHFVFHARKWGSPFAFSFGTLFEPSHVQSFVVFIALSVMDFSVLRPARCVGTPSVRYDTLRHSGMHDLHSNILEVRVENIADIKANCLCVGRPDGCVAGSLWAVNRVLWIESRRVKRCTGVRLLLSLFTVPNRVGAVFSCVGNSKGGPSCLQVFLCKNGKRQ